MSSTPVARDQAFPDRPVRIIDPFGAGGGVDVIARALASRLAAAWGQPAIVENHPGGGSTAAPALVANAPADGYTLLINTSAQAYSAARAGELPYDPLRDFVPVAALTSQPYVLVAGAQSGITTIDELAAAASDRPGEIRFASAGTGTGTHLAVAKLNRDLGIAAVHTPPAATDAITDVIAGTAAGHTTYAMLPIPPAAPYLRGGGLVALGVSTARRRSRLLPDVPPLTAAGVAGFDFPIWYGIWAPAQTPPGIVSTLARDIADTLATAELSEWLTQHDADPMHMSPAEFGAFVVSEAESPTDLDPDRIGVQPRRSSSGPPSLTERPDLSPRQDRPSDRCAVTQGSFTEPFSSSSRDEQAKGSAGPLARRMAGGPRLSTEWLTG